MYQQWKFNDLTQISKRDLSLNISSKSKCLDEEDIITKSDCPSTSNSAKVKSTHESRGAIKLKRTKLPDKIHQNGKRKVKRRDIIDGVFSHKYSLAPENLRTKNYGAIKITMKGPLTSQGSVIRLNKVQNKMHSIFVRKKKRLPEETLNPNSDPFQFVIISDQIKYLTPSEACLKLPREFSEVKKQILEFQSIWAHRTSEF